MRKRDPTNEDLVVSKHELVKRVPNSHLIKSYSKEIPPNNQIDVHTDVSNVHFFSLFFRRLRGKHTWSSETVYIGDFID